ncbi:MAG: asparaginase [Candidatus Gastranaerophilales bacterium]|nr:asparaginase [Candidatus Gastranaerophilales bacterium]
MLVQHIRHGLIEEEHDGYVLTTKQGYAPAYPYYLRSCAKPLQASLLIDFELDRKYKLTGDEIALCCASHAGEKCHTDIAESLLNKFRLEYDWLKCGLHKPLSRTRQNEMLINNEEINYFHNNCVGKHIMFLALCKENGWDISEYDNIKHPLQILVKERINSLCNVREDYPVTKDGCGVPIFSMPLENMLNGFINLFCDKKYEKIKNAFLEFPYIIGGESRLDTEIMQNSRHLAAKVGAGGLCIVVNTRLKDGLIVKINDCNMDTRRLVVFEVLNRLGWSEYECCKDISTLHGEKVGVIKIADCRKSDFRMGDPCA